MSRQGQSHLSYRGFVYDVWYRFLLNPVGIVHIWFGAVRYLEPETLGWGILGELWFHLPLEEVTMVGLILKGQSRLCQFDTTGLPRGMPGHPDVSNGHHVGLIWKGQSLGQLFRYYNYGFLTLPRRGSPKF